MSYLAAFLNLGYWMHSAGGEIVRELGCDNDDDGGREIGEMYPHATRLSLCDYLIVG